MIPRRSSSATSSVSCPEISYEQLTDEPLQTIMEIAIVEAMDPALPGIGGGETYSVNLLQYLLRTGIPTIFIGTSSPASPSSPRAFTFVPATDSPSQGNLGYVLRLALSRSFASVPPGAVIVKLSWLLTFASDASPAVTSRQGSSLPAV